MRTVLRWLATVALVAASWAILAILPPRSAMLDPFRTEGTVGTAQIAGGVVATVHGASVSARLTQDSWDSGTSPGISWLVIELDAASTGQDGRRLQTAALQLDDASWYQVSERVDTLRDDVLRIDFAQSGFLAFEVPSERVHGTATLLLSSGIWPTTALDDQLAIPLVLDELPEHAQLELGHTEWATR